VLLGITVGGERLIVQTVACVCDIQAVEGREAENVLTGRGGLGEGWRRHRERKQQCQEHEKSSEHDLPISYRMSKDRCRAVPAGVA